MVTHMTRPAKFASTPRRINRRFARTAFGEGYGELTPQERAVRRAWLEDSHARERQLLQTTGQTLRGYTEAPLVDSCDAT